MTPDEKATANKPRALPRVERDFDWGFLIVAALSFGSAGYVLLTEGLTVARDILLEDAKLFITILPKVMLGILIGALIRVMISRETIEKHIGEGSGFKGLLLAGALGIAFPAGPFTIFPLAVIMLASGADRGAALSFTTGWLLLGLNRAIIWELPFFGTDFVVLRFLISLPVPVLVGCLARLAVFDGLVLHKAAASKKAEPAP